MDVFSATRSIPGATHYIIHAFDDPVHAPLALEAARAYAEIVPAVSHARSHADAHLHPARHVERGGAPERARVQRRADLWQPGDSPGDMAHSGDWGQYGFLQLGDYAGARERIEAVRGDGRR